MKASFFQRGGYSAPQGIRCDWPVSPALYDPEYGRQSLHHANAQCEFADHLGFDWVSFSEHHYMTTVAPNPALAAAAVATRVRNAKIAMIGHNLTLNNPIKVAEDLATLDTLSDGRLVVGFLRGTPNEFLAYDTNPDETRSRTQEASILILRALTEPQPFGWEGRHYRFRTVSVWPGPIQQPHPPIYYSGNSLESTTFAAAHRLGLGISFYPPHMVAQLIDHYKQECAKHGWEPSPDQLLYRCFAAVCEDDKEADALGAAFSGMRQAVESLMQGRGAVLPRPPQSQVGLGLGELRFCGSPETLVRQMTDFHEATGVGVIDVGFAGDPTQAIRLFGTEVLPRLRHIGARSSQSPDVAVAAAD